MGEYTEIQGQIARIKAAWSAFHDKIGVVEIGTCETSIETNGSGFYARSRPREREPGHVLIAYRPTIAGALLAIESELANMIDDKIGELKMFEDLRATLKLPEVVIGGDK